MCMMGEGCLAKRKGVPEGWGMEHGKKQRVRTCFEREECQWERGEQTLKQTSKKFLVKENRKKVRVEYKWFKRRKLSGLGSGWCNGTKKREGIRYWI